MTYGQLLWDLDAAGCLPLWQIDLYALDAAYSHGLVGRFKDTNWYCLTLKGQMVIDLIREKLSPSKKKGKGPKK